VVRLGRPLPGSSGDEAQTIWLLVCGLFADDFKHSSGILVVIEQLYTNDLCQSSACGWKEALDTLINVARPSVNDEGCVSGRDYYQITVVRV
jgi:hypothetical protein